MLGISSSCVNANSPYERGIQIEPSQTVFQSTHPSRGATVTLSHIPQSNEFQSTHPSRGATVQSSQRKHRHFISIHAPREGCDVGCPIFFMAYAISIHAPREGCDFHFLPRLRPGSNFNPRTP